MPFTKNQIITLEIEALSNDGNGVAHKDGQAVFVPLTAPGDVAEVRIVKPMKTYAFGRVEKLLTAGPGRVRQDCAVAGPYWIDTTTANKGVGVESLCRVLGFAHDEVMAFGDNYNDVAMLDLVGTPYIMDSAAAPLRARYPLHTPRPEDVLREFLQK